MPAPQKSGNRLSRVTAAQLEVMLLGVILHETGHNLLLQFSPPQSLKVVPAEYSFFGEGGRFVESVLFGGPMNCLWTSGDFDSILSVGTWQWRARIR
jgi:hypothetical protein